MCKFERPCMAAPKASQPRWIVALSSPRCGFAGQAFARQAEQHPAGDRAGRDCNAVEEIAPSDRLFHASPPFLRRHWIGNALLSPIAGGRQFHHHIGRGYKYDGLECREPARLTMERAVSDGLA